MEMQLQQRIQTVFYLNSILTYIYSYFIHIITKENNYGIQNTHNWIQNSFHSLSIRI